MKLKFVVKDVPYMRALAGFIEKSDQNIFVEIGQDFSQSPGVMIVSDVGYEEFRAAAKDREVRGIVFLEDSSDAQNGEIENGGPFRLYKYCGSSRLLADLRLFYYIWSGERIERRNDAKLISVCTDRDVAVSSDFSAMLARHYVYRTGGEALLINFSYTDPFTPFHDDDDLAFRKLVYCIEYKKQFPREAFFYKDPYGVSYLRTGRGLNPVAGLPDDILSNLIEQLVSGVFDLVILDIGTACSERNIGLIKRSGHRYWLHCAEKDSPGDLALTGSIFGGLPYTAYYAGKGSSRLSLAADDQIRVIFGAVNNDKGNSAKVS